MGLLLLVGLLLGSVLSLFAAMGVKKTSGAEFCGSCHSMEFVTKSYRKDVHGGAGRQGVVVECASCHLPHGNLPDYLLIKGIRGAHDVYGEFVKGADNIDWEKKREHRELFVYDTGCLSCHSNLREATMSNPSAFIAHKEYFNGTTQKKCVSCHKHVGHKNLSDYLPEKKQ